MSTPPAGLAPLRSSTQALLHGLAEEGWADKDVHAASLLPGWTRGHVLTHLARNADGITRTLRGALRGEVLARYPDGVAGRDADIEAGASRPIAEQLADVRESAHRLDVVCDEVTDAGTWARPTDSQRPAAGQLLARRWEVEIHRVDLDGTYTACDWPGEFVSFMLREAVAGLDERIPDGQALRIEVDPDGSSSKLGDTVWTCGSGGEPEAVSGPDWALLAWALGRPAACAGALSAMPQLNRWR
jgi:maleylpyruvate isomerase